MRCFVFGCIGFVPVLGLGLAVQTVRLSKTICAEVSGQSRTPPVYWLWVAAVVVLWIADQPLGLVGDLVILFLFLAVQCWWLWREFPPESRLIWNPGYWHVFWGAALAYGGILNSLASVTVLLAQLNGVDWSE